MAEPPKLKKVWKSIDAWRGHYTYELDEKDKARARVIDLVYVARNPEENEKFLSIAKTALKKAGFKVRKAIHPSSNVFAMNVSLIVYKDEPFTESEKKFLDEFEDIYLDTYTRSFSIFTGETYPIEFEEFKKNLKEISKVKLNKEIEL